MMIPRRASPPPRLAAPRPALAGGRGSARGGRGRIGVLLALLLGCGARAAVYGDDDPANTPGGSAGAGATGAESDREPAGGGEAAPSDPGGPLEFEGVVLPECEPGVPATASSWRRCAYLFDAACYDDPLMACACACRGRERSRCIIGGFLNPDEPQRVRCTAR